MTQKYSKYKDSGFEWIGEIPEHWEVKKLKHIGTIRSGESLTNNIITEHGDYEVFGGNGFMGYFNKYNVSGKKIIIGRVGALCGNVRLINEKKWVTDNALILDLMSERLYRYVILYLGIANLNNLNTSNAQPLITGTKVLNVQILYPPLPEQESIAQFLDEKCARIDEAVRIKEKQIDLLKEYRQIAIHQAVTKGLNDQVKMKDSGIDWIGEIPEHWLTIPIRRVIKITDGTHDTPLYIDKGENTYPLITSKDFSEGRVCFDECKYISANDHNSIKKRSEVCNGDILMSMIGGNIGKSVIVDSDFEFSVKNVAIFKTKNDGSQAKYLLYYLNSGLLSNQIQIKSRGGAQGFLSLADIKNLIFFKIPLHEQAQIAAHIESLTAKTDQAIRLKEQQIEQLKQYKTSLINDVVTGKVRVA